MEQQQPGLTFWTYVTPDGRPSRHRYRTALSAASAAYWDSLGGPADLSGYTSELLLRLVADRGYRVQPESD